MHWLEVPSFADKALSRVQTQDEVTAKLAREAWVIGAGLTNGIAEGAKQSWEDPQGTAGRVGLSLGIGLVLGVAQRSAGVARLAAEAVATGFGFAFAFDALTPKRWQAVENALIDTWNSPANTNRNALVISNQLGRFVFDVGLTMAGTLGGAKLGQHFMRQLQPPTVSGSCPGFSSGEQTAWSSAGRKFNTMPMTAAEVAAVQAGNTPIEPIIVRVNSGPGQRMSAYEAAAAEVPVSPAPAQTARVLGPTSPRTEFSKSKSPVTSMPAVTGMRDGGNGNVILELADGTTVTTRKTGA